MQPLKNLFGWGAGAPLRFGGTPGVRPDALILALHGGTQSVSDTLFSYLDFREMSQLEHLADERTVVVMPQAPFRTWALYRQRDLDLVRGILQRENPVRAVGCGFSQGATFLAHATRHVRFDGVVICSGIRAPGDAWRTQPARRGPCDSLIWVGAEEPEENAWWRPLRATQEEAEALRDEFSPLGRCRLEAHPGGHRWPAAWNPKIREFFRL